MSAEHISNESNIGTASIWTRCRYYLEMIRFSHTLFAMPFAVLSLVWATQTPTASGSALYVMDWKRWLGVVLCMVMARSFAMAVNRVADAAIDAANPRTAQRHIPAGKLSKAQVIGFAIACVLMFVASCALFLPNRLPLMLSIPVLAFVAGYSYAKRFSSLVHFWLGAALMLAPVCTWIALRGEVVQSEISDLYPAMALGIAVLLWVAGFDVIYACQDEKFDRESKLHSLPAVLTAKNALRIAAACHAGMWLVLVGLAFAFPVLSLGWIWYAAVGGIGLLLAYEHSIVSAEDLSRVQIAFFQMNVGIGFLLCVAGSIDSILR